MSNDNPFYLTKIECPICKTINEFETIRVGSYFENGRDTDFCPKDVTWRYQRYQSYNPLLYFTAVCSNCYYAREFNNSYKEWKNDNNFRSFRLKMLKEKHLDHLATSDSVIKMMAKTIDTANYPNESAIIKLLITIYDELLCDRVNNLDLGRFYLRIGWIFREFKNEENPNQSFVKGLLHEVDNSFLSFKDNAQTSLSQFDKFAAHIQAHFETTEVSSDTKAKMLAYRDKIEEAMSSFRGKFDDIKNDMIAFGDLLTEYKASTLGFDEASDGFGFHGYHSFGEFLSQLQKSWSDAVTNEKEALEKAVLYYKKAFESGRDIAPGNQQIQATYLIAELSRRVGDFDGAKQYFNSTIKAGQEFIYKNRNDKSRTALTRKILELAIEQGKLNMEASKAK